MKNINPVKISLGLMMSLLVFTVSCDNMVDSQKFDSLDQPHDSMTAFGTLNISGSENNSFPLFAGQDMNVGIVNVKNDAEYIYVEYEMTDEEWCITETHLHVGESLGDFPLRGRWGNPAPGQFDYKENHNPCVETYTYTIPIDSEWGEDLKIAAHAALESQITESIIYGVTDNGEIFAIDMLSGDEVFITGNLSNEGGNSWPNGLAFDQENGRLYYSDGSARNEIFFYDMDTGDNHSAGVAGGVVAGAEFAGGAYWYIVNGTDEFRKMTFDADGKNGQDEYVANLGTSHNLGDLAVNFSETILYGHSNTSIGDAFFSIDLDDNFAYTEIKQPAGKNLQIAFGSDGILYGVTTGTGNWYTIDLTDGTRTDVRDTDKRYTDLANGREFTIKTESAWGAFDVGDKRFTEQGNWATYFEYTVQQQQYTFVESVDVPSENADGITTQSVLKDGQLYRFRASGTYTYNNAGDWADAEWYLKDGEIVKGDDEGSVPWVLDVSVRGYVQNIDWGDFNEDHIYYYEFTGTGDTVNFFIHDSYYPDNEGSIKVDIYKINW